MGMDAPHFQARHGFSYMFQNIRDVKGAHERDNQTSVHLQDNASRMEHFTATPARELSFRGPIVTLLIFGAYSKPHLYGDWGVN